MVAGPVDGRGRPAENELVCRLEAHALTAWPATISELTPGGWVLRATPGLDRGRSNNALTPCRELDPGEIAPALERAAAFARDHDIPLGIQVSPLHLHRRLQEELDRRGWTTRWRTLVMARAPGAPPAPVGPELTVEPEASPEWLAAWARCEGRADVADHAVTVLAALRGRAWFTRIGDDAVAIAVPGDGLLGLYSIAVAPERRRTGLGRGIVAGLLQRAPRATAYLQVNEDNPNAIALYERLGFAGTYRYDQRYAPA